LRTLNLRAQCLDAFVQWRVRHEQALDAPAFAAIDAESLDLVGSCEGVCACSAAQGGKSSSRGPPAQRRGIGAELRAGG